MKGFTVNLLIVVLFGLSSCVPAFLVRPATAGPIDLRVLNQKGRTIDSVGVIMGTGRSPHGPRRAEPFDFTEAEVFSGNFVARLRMLHRQNRKLIEALRRDANAMNQALSRGAYSKAETRIRLTDIRRRRMDARLGLNLINAMNPVAADSTYTARWGVPVQRSIPVQNAPNILVVNRTRRNMAVDIWDVDSVRVAYVPFFCGFKEEEMPSDKILERLAGVKIQVRFHDPAAAAVLAKRLLVELEEGISGPLLEIVVSDRWGAGSGSDLIAPDTVKRGVQVLAAVMAPRPLRLFLEGVGPVFAPGMEDVEVIQLPGGQRHGE